MRVAYVIGRFPMLSEPFILNQITGAVARGCDVNIFAVQGPPDENSKIHPDFHRFGLDSRTHYPPAPPADKSERPAMLRAVLQALATTHGAAARALEKLAAATTPPPWKLCLRGAEMAKHGPYDVIHCQFGFFAEQIITLRDAGVVDGTIITTFRGGDISRYVDENGPGVYAKTFAGGDYFLANCGFFRDKAVAIGCPADRIEVHGSGIDLSRFTVTDRPAPTTEPIRIASTGRLVEKKGLPYLIEGFASLVKKGWPVHLDLIGDGPLRTELEAQIAALGCGDAVTMHGWRNQTEIIDILSACHLFVAASVTAANGDQDAPVNTLKEAMAMGLPVVATRHGGIPELVEDGVSGYLVPERDGPAIAAALSRLIDRRDTWPQMGTAGRQAVERQFDMVRLNDRLVALYETLSKTRGGRLHVRAS